MQPETMSFRELIQSAWNTGDQHGMNDLTVEIELTSDQKVED
jgi:hypothetical protein